jgi:hypothetical protein
MPNYCIIKKNKIYEELYDNVEQEELSMNNPNHEDKIKYLIEKTITNNKEIEFYHNENTDMNSLFEELLEILLNHDTQKNSQGNTLLLYADLNEMYEMIFIEQDNYFDDSDLNQFASISNSDLKTIYNSCGIIKTVYKNDKIKNDLISSKDINKILYYNFYHIGLMVDELNNMKELVFSGDMPYNFIGSNFKMLGSFERVGLHIVVFKEEGKIKNEKVSKFCEMEICGRVYITLLNPPNNKKFSNFTKDLFNLILTIMDNKSIIDNIEKEIIDDKLSNPFLIIKKYANN